MRPFNCLHCGGNLFMLDQVTLGLHCAGDDCADIYSMEFVLEDLDY